jgi:hypothetical protein
VERGIVDLRSFLFDWCGSQKLTPFSRQFTSRLRSGYQSCMYQETLDDIGDGDRWMSVIAISQVDAILTIERLFPGATT